MKDNPITIIGGESTWDGDLKFSGMARVDSDFSGQITSDGTLVVGRNAHVRADIRVKKLILFGVLEGDVYASQQVHLDATAQLTGNVHSPIIVAIEGALLNGNLRMR